MSILDHPAISRRYLFPAPRLFDSPYYVKVDGIELACYRRVVDESLPTLVHFHGNGETVSDYVDDFPNRLESIGLNSLLVEYREYGGSSGEAALAAMLGDGEAVFKAAGLDPKRTISFGRSIGSLYSIELVDRIPEIGGLIIESGIAQLIERLDAHVDYSDNDLDRAEIESEALSHFNHKRKLGRYKGPLLLLHTEKDYHVEISHAERNLKWSASPQKELVRFPIGDHNSIMAWNEPDYFAAIAKFAKRI